MPNEIPPNEAAPNAGAPDATATPDLLRALAPQVLGAVARRHGDFADAEDAVQEALIAAAEQWPASGVPANPSGWLYRVALRRLVDHARAERARHRREDMVGNGQLADAPFVTPPDAALADVPLADADSGPDPDDTLALLFMCCHPALTGPSAIALTLRAVGGLTTAEIARAFLVPEATMAQRISRAKQTIRASGVPFRLPNAAERAERLRAVLHVLYLIFNEGYASSAGPALHRVDLSDEAIRLGRLTRALLPHDAEVAGLLALMLLTDARRAARAGPNGELIPLDEQDRGLWDRRLIAEGVALVSDALGRGAVGPYQLQAAIAAVHDEAPRAADTDWPQILALYGVLTRMSDNPVVALNHAVAAAMVRGPAAGLTLLGALDGDARLTAHHRLDAVRAHLLEMAGDRAAALERYHAAASRAASVPERNYLLAKAARLAAAPNGSNAAQRRPAVPNDSRRRRPAVPDDPPSGPARTFTYRSARSPALTAGLVAALLIEAAAVHLLLRGRHPAVAWALTAMTLLSAAWLLRDARAFARGALRLDAGALHVEVGRRWRGMIPRDAIADAVHPAWRDLPAAGTPAAEGYANLTKPAQPNVLVVLRPPVALRFLSAATRRVARVGVHLDAPEEFLDAVRQHRSGQNDRYDAGPNRPRRSEYNDR